VCIFGLGVDITMLGSIMTEITNIELDLLLRIDFFELTNYGERNNYSDREFEEDKLRIKTKYGIKETYKRIEGGFEYVRLKDVAFDLNLYRRYLEDLKSTNKFSCCQLEQAVGLFEEDKMLIFFSTDSGFCFNSIGHIDAMKRMYNNQTIEEWYEDENFDVNTFIGTLRNNELTIQYSQTSNNIEANDPKNKSYKVNYIEFDRKLKHLKDQISIFYNKIKPSVKQMTQNQEDEEINEVFNESIKN